MLHKGIHITCKCQKRNVLIIPIPAPITKAVTMHMSKRRFVSSLKTAIKSGMPLNCDANTFVLFAISFNCSF